MLLEKIVIKTEASTRPHAVSECEMQKGIGIVSQLQSKDRTRQISLLSADAAMQVAEMGKIGLCMPRFYANFILSGNEFSCLTPGVRLKVGTAILRVSDRKKNCFADCVLVKQSKDCPLQTGCVFAWVEEDGNAAAGDVVAVES